MTESTDHVEDGSSAPQPGALIPKYTGEIPYDADGRPRTYVPKFARAIYEKMTVEGQRRVYVEYRPNVVTYRVLEFSGFERGRSAAHAVFYDVLHGEPVRFQMFLTDLESEIRDGNFDTHILEGLFEFCKRGQNYAIRRYDDGT